MDDQGPPSENEEDGFRYEVYATSPPSEAMSSETAIRNKKTKKQSHTTVSADLDPSNIITERRSRRLMIKAARASTTRRDVHAVSIMDE